MKPPNATSPRPDSERHHQRDAISLRLIGLSFAVFGLLVLAGLFWEQPAHQRLATTVSSALLVLIGAMTFLAGRRLARGGKESQK
jgi:hypothetical protein